MRLIVDVDEADIGNVRVGQSARFRVDAYPDRVFESRVREVRSTPKTSNGVVTYQTVLERRQLRAPAAARDDGNGGDHGHAGDRRRAGPERGAALYATSERTTGPGRRVPVAAAAARAATTGSLRPKTRRRMCGPRSETSSSPIDVETGATDGRVTVVRGGDLKAGTPVIVDLALGGPVSGMSEPLIEFDRVVRTYGKGHAEVQALAGVDLQVHEGEFVAVMGPSGSGKSTAMNILGCLDVPTSGAYRFRGVDVGARHAPAARAAATLLSRVRLPGIQPAQSHLGARERRAAADLPRDGRGRAPASRARSACDRRAERAGSRTRLPSSRAGRCSASRSHAPSSPNRRCCSPTSRPAISTRARSVEIMELLVGFNREPRHHDSHGDART